MPYYVFSVRPYAQIKQLAEFAVFKEASVHAKSLRMSESAADTKIKIMFADNPQLAEDLLCQVREPGPSGDE